VFQWISAHFSYLGMGLHLKSHPKIRGIRKKLQKHLNLLMTCSYSEICIWCYKIGEASICHLGRHLWYTSPQPIWGDRKLSEQTHSHRESIHQPHQLLFIIAPNKTYKRYEITIERVWGNQHSHIIFSRTYLLSVLEWDLVSWIREWGMKNFVNF